MKNFFINFLKKVDKQLKQPKQSPINNDFLQSQKEKNSLVLQDNNTIIPSISKSVYTCNAKTIRLLKLLTDNSYFNSYSIFKELLDLCHKNGINAQADFTYRSIEEQNELYAQGRTKPGNIITRAKGGQSFHNYGLAIDIFVNDVNLKNEKGELDIYTMNEKIWELAKKNQFDTKYGLYWGGLFKSIKDIPHFELSHGLTISAYKKKFGLE